MVFLDDGPEAVAAFLSRSDRFVLTGHSPLDGDGLGSALGLCRSLRLSGRTAHVVSDAPVPSNLRWLPGAAEVIPWSKGLYASHPGLADPQALLCFDSGDTKRLGGPFDELPPTAAVINVDHHVTNTRFGVLNWVDEAAPSVGEMVFRLLRATGMPVDADVALNLYLSLVEDTGRFSYSNTTPEALRAAADLVAAGAQPRPSRTTSSATRTSGPCACARGACRALRDRRGRAPRHDLRHVGRPRGARVARGRAGPRDGRGRHRPRGHRRRHPLPRAAARRGHEGLLPQQDRLRRRGGLHRARRRRALEAAGCTVKDDDLARVREALTAEVAAALERTPRS